MRQAGAQRIEVAHQNWPLRGGTVSNDGIGGNLGLQAKVGQGTRTALLDDVLAPPGFVLLGRDRDPVTQLSPIQHAAWRELQGRGAHFGPGGLADVDGAYGQWFDRLNASVVLIRPDFQLFGGVADPRDTEGMVRDLAGRVLA
jgi:hypothetical protein